VSVLYFLLLVGVLVLIHELGHFVAAKLLDVKVLRFSIGYGRPLVRFKLRETEYQIGIFPIGGYVRILGIESPQDDGKPTRSEDIGRSFASRPLWQRIVIVFAGPAANLVLPVIIYFVFFAGHTVLPAAVVGDVLDGGAAQRAGLEPGDRILEIDGTAIRYWEEIEDAVRTSAGKELHLRVQRNGRVFERYLTPIEETVHSRDGGTSRQGRVGITHSPFIPLIGVIDPKSPAAKANLKTGDLIISVHGQAVRNWGDVQKALGKVPRRTSLAYFRGTEVPGIPQIQLLAPGFADLVPPAADATTPPGYTGLEHAEMFVARVDAGSPADNAGVKPGDLIIALDDKPLHHWMELEQRLQAAPDKTFKLSWKRQVGGTIKLEHAEVTQVQRQQLDDYDHTVTRLVFGASNDIDRGRGATVAIEGRFGYALGKALERTGETISTMVAGFFQIISGETPRDALGGPLTILRAASVSGDQGWDSFLLMLALISVNLGLLNLLPIPMLDGGHLLVFAIEGARRKPLSEVARGRIQLVGLILIGLITLLAAGNDIVRFFF
jgi:regulator of sigma E protease